MRIFWASVPSFTLGIMILIMKIIMIVTTIITQKVSMWESVNSTLLFTISQIPRDAHQRTYNTVLLALPSKFLFGLTAALLLPL